MPEHTPAPTPSRAVYGFVLHMAFKTFFVLYLAWALIPESLLIKWNINYMPQRYWAVSIPVFLLVVLALFAFIIYPSLNLCMIPNINDILTIQEDSVHHKNIVNKYTEYESDQRCCCKNKSKCFKEKYDVLSTNNKNFKLGYSVPIVEDLDKNTVCQLLYFKE